MLAYLFRYDVIKRLSHGYCPIGPMGNAMRAVPSHGTFPMGIPFPWTSLDIPSLAAKLPAANLGRNLPIHSIRFYNVTIHMVNALRRIYLASLSPVDSSY